MYVSTPEEFYYHKLMLANDLSSTQFYCKYFVIVLSIGCVYRRFTEKRQEEKEGTPNTIVLEKEEGEKEGRSIIPLGEQHTNTEHKHTHTFVIWEKDAFRW